MGERLGVRDKNRRTRSLPIFPVGPERPGTLSFWNLAEAHILAAITRQHGVRLQSARKALDYVEHKLEKARPLITQDFHTDGVNLFVEGLEALADDDPGERALVNASSQEQLAARDLLQGVLQRV